MWKLLPELLVALALAGLLFLKLDPFSLLPMEPWFLVTLCIVVALAGLFAGLGFREQPRDEREDWIRHLSNRAGYLAGVLLSGGFIIYQALTGTLDLALVILLDLMVITKVGVLIWFKIRT